MKDLLNSDFFDLESFSHKELFLRTVHPWEALSRLEEYLESQRLGKILGEVEEGAVIIHPELVSIGEGTKVESGSYIVGPCVIGKNSSVRQGAYLRGIVLAGDNVVLGHTTEAKKAVFFDGAKAGHFAYVCDSILGHKVNLGAGTKCANLRFDHKEVVISWSGKTYSTGLKKFGAILGDRVQTGCNAVLNPGTLVGPHSLWGPCLNWGGVMPSHSRLKGNQGCQITSLSNNK